MRDGGRRGRHPLTASWSSLADWLQVSCAFLASSNDNLSSSFHRNLWRPPPSCFGKIKRAKISPVNSQRITGCPEGATAPRWWDLHLAIWKLSGMPVQRDAVSQPWPGLTRDLSGIVETAVKAMARICMTGMSSLPRGGALSSYRKYRKQVSLARCFCGGPV